MVYIERMIANHVTVATGEDASMFLLMFDNISSVCWPPMDVPKVASSFSTEFSSWLISTVFRKAWENEVAVWTERRTANEPTNSCVSHQVKSIPSHWRDQESVRMISFALSIHSRQEAKIQGSSCCSAYTIPDDGVEFSRSS
jgi:hypothetical protein